MAASMDITVPRNGDYFWGWNIEDDEGGAIDITGMTPKLQVRAVAGQGPLIASAIFSGRDDASGFFNVRLRGSDFASVPGPMEIVRLAYDFTLSGDGITLVASRGQVLLVPGVTQ